MKTAIITERILFKKGRRIICYIDIMPEKIEVKTGKPSDATCISWIYQPNELERAKATATEFFDNVTRIWTTEREKESKNRLKERDMKREERQIYYYTSRNTGVVICFQII